MEEIIFKKDMQEIIKRRIARDPDSYWCVLEGTDDIVEELLIYIKERFGDDSIKNATYFKR